MSTPKETSLKIPASYQIQKPVEREFFPETQKLNAKLREMAQYNLDTGKQGQRPRVR